MHPAPYPIDLVEPLIRMFSFVGDTISLIHFLGQVRRAWRPLRADETASEWSSNGLPSHGG